MTTRYEQAKARIEAEIRELENRLMDCRTVSESGCWLWTKSLTDLGYGRMSWRNHIYRVHRLSAHIWLGLDLGNPKIFACHKCDTPRCFNPDHLFLGTQKENMADCLAKKRGFKGAAKQEFCKKGHWMADSRSRTSQTCRICLNAYRRRYLKERKLAADLIIEGVLGNE